MTEMPMPRDLTEGTKDKIFEYADLVARQGPDCDAARVVRDQWRDDSGFLAYADAIDNVKRCVSPEFQSEPPEHLRHRLVEDDLVGIEADRLAVTEAEWDQARMRCTSTHMPRLIAEVRRLREESASMAAHCRASYDYASLQREVDDMRRERDEARAALRDVRNRGHLIPCGSVCDSMVRCSRCLLREKIDRALGEEEPTND